MNALYPLAILSAILAFGSFLSSPPKEIPQRSNQILRFLHILQMMVTLVLLAIPRAEDGFQIKIGIALFFLATTIFWGCRLGPNTHEGIYRIVRHPTLSAYVLGWWASAIATGNLFLWGAALTFPLIYRRLVRQMSRVKNSPSPTVNLKQPDSLDHPPQKKIR